MGWLKIPGILISYFLTIFNVSYSQTSDEALSHINANITDNSALDNIAYYEQLDNSGFFDTLECQVAALILHRIGVSLYEIDKNLEAAQFYENKVIPLWESCQQRNNTDFANSLYNTGVSYQFADNFVRARSYFHRSLRYFEEDPSYSPIKLSSKYAGTARFYQDAQSYVRAENYYTSAIRLIENASDSKSRYARYLHDLGVTLNDMERYADAIDYFKKAIAISLDINDRRRLAMSYHNIGLSYLELDSLDLAEDFTFQAAALHRDHSYFLSNDLELLGAVELRKENVEGSESYHTRALSLRKENRNFKRAISSSYENFADLYKVDRIEDARKYIDSAIYNLIINPRKNHLGNPMINDLVSIHDVSLIKYMGIKAKLYSDDLAQARDLEITLDLYSRIDSLMSKNIFDLHFEQSRLAYLGLLYEYYNDAIEYCGRIHQLYPKSGYDRLAFHYSSKTKSLVLINELKEYDWYHLVDNEELENQKIEAQLNVKNLYSELVEYQSDSTDLITKYLAAQRDLESLLESIDSLRTDVGNLAAPLITLMSIGDIQSNLKEHQVYIEYFLGNANLFIFKITKSNFDLNLVPDYDQLAPLVSTLNVMISTNDVDVSKIDSIRKEVSLILNPQTFTNHTNHEEWIIVADGFLHQFAFDLLVSLMPDHKYIIEDVAITTGYSANLLFQNKDLEIRNKYIGIGTEYSSSISANTREHPSFNNPVLLTQLPMAEKEIASCKDIMDGRAHLGVAATKESFVANWKNYDIVHLALHGYVDVDYYEKSCLIFDDRSPDNILYLSELDAIASESRLVLLSSCHTASGQLFKGEGIIGLTKSFLKSGQTTVISSLWSASDISASKLIPTFFDYFKGGAPLSKALRLSKLDYLKSSTPSQRHPYYWANFQVVGQGRLVLGSSGQSLIASPIFWFLILVGLLLLYFISKKI